MTRKDDAKISLSKLLISMSFIIPVIVTPHWTFDPGNISKLFTLIIFSMVMLLLLPRIGFEQYRMYAKEISFATLLLFFVFLGFLTNNPSLSAFYGEITINMGLLAYTCLIITLIASILVGRLISNWIIKVIIITGTLNVIYGYIQFLGLDPAGYRSDQDPIIGTLGNSNFFSAYIGITTLASLFSYLNTLDFRRLVFFAFIFISLLFLCYQNQSIQGIFVFLFGSSIFIYLRFLRTKSRKIKGILIGIFVSTASIAFLGIFGKGPLSVYLFQESNKARIEYWTAALRLLKLNLVNGVGPDNFGVWYPSVQTSYSFSTYGQYDFANSSHNSILDLALSGGIGAAVVFLVLLMLSIISLKRYIRSEAIDSKKLEAITIFCLWMAFFFQSLLSVQKISLYVLGFVLLGITLSFGRGIDIKAPKKLTHKLDPGNLMLSFLGLAIGMSIGLPALIQSINFQTALESRKSTNLINAATLDPKNAYHLTHASRILFANNLYEESLKLAEDSIEVEPLSILAWEMVYQNPLATPTQKATARNYILSRSPNWDFSKFNIK